MPRRSSEALTGELWREQLSQPQPLPPVPSSLKGAARQAYAEVLAFYPPSRFAGGAHVLLEQFAFAVGELRRLNPKLRELEPGTVAYSRTLRQIGVFTQIMTSTATKLRLTPSTRYRADATDRLDERRPPRNRLLGGELISLAFRQNPAR